MDLTIITAYYHGGKYINKLFEMIHDSIKYAKDSGLNIDTEYMIINDSPEERIKSNNPYNDFQFIVINNRENLGIHKTRINGINRARGKYILILDQDDEILPCALYLLMKNKNDYDLVIANGYCRENETKTTIYHNKFNQWMTSKWLFYAYCTSLCVAPGHVLIKKDSIPSEWIHYPITENGSDDYFLWILMLDRNAKINLIKNHIYVHNATGKNLSNNYIQMHKSELSMAYLLQDNRLISKKFTKLFMRRTIFKNELHYGKKGILSKTLMCIRNVDVIFFTIVFKMARKINIGSYANE